ncbi:DNA-3-methyladenine glycosylase [Pusillimonas sp. ANT_WB101]|uniref:DNA-3-methyladenine glycosylase n=1 Tax=Pusillimonas sp. ANT_WB101 TaxID=2597356 RepID=UPI0011EC0FC1|nr:DNA-3-methyladenine glycosylase [Pusillimonas sp. ANT_WB101]KAA0910543.1 DNA-3-methyladenine glycosylase [Pusillimonas sp. ANT_WB101]
MQPVNKFLSLCALPRQFYARDTITVAKALLGKYLVHVVDGQARIGRIVENEAYLGPLDLAAHASKGLTKRTRAMFGPPGHAYIYLIYGMHHCMNVVTEPEGSGTGVLLRAVEPIANLSDNTRGPGRLCKALGIDLTLYGHDFCSDTLYIANAPDEQPAFTIIERPRIGVDYAGEWAAKPLRFYIEGNPYVSRR